MEAGSDPTLTWIFVGAILLIFVPPLAWMATRWVQHKLHKRVVNSPRKIAVVGQDDRPACTHERSKRRARVGPSGDYTSVCKRCGVPMKRNGPGDWEAV